MKKIIPLLAFMMLLSGCAKLTDSNAIPPAAPRGVQALSLDQEVLISWLANTEPNIRAYKVYVSNAYDGRYTLIGRTSDLFYHDTQITNGVKYYYAVTALDDNGLESDLSKENVNGTPRPEGTVLNLPEVDYDPLHSGYSFAGNTLVPYNSNIADFYYDFLSLNGYGYIVAVNGCDIQDMGYTSSFDDITYAPSNGWSPSRSAIAILGHTYVFVPPENNYAKIRITVISDIVMTFDWAYQTTANNRQLKVGK